MVAIGLIIAGATGAFSGYKQKVNETENGNISNCTTEACKKLELQFLYNSRLIRVNPCSNFFKFSCDRFDFMNDKYRLHNVRIDAKELIRMKVDETLKAHLNETNENDVKSIKYIKTVYWKCTNFFRDGTKETVELWNTINNSDDLSDQISSLITTGVSAFIDVSVKPDPFEPTKYILWLNQPQFGLPKGDLIFKDLEALEEIRYNYLWVLNSTFDFHLNEDNKVNLTNAINDSIAFEMELAAATKYPSEYDSIKDQIQKMTLGDLKKKMNDDPIVIDVLKKVSLKLEESNLKVDDYTNVIVSDLEYFTKLPNIIKKFSKGIKDETRNPTKTYASLRMLKEFAYLSGEFYTAWEKGFELNPFENPVQLNRCTDLLRKYAPLALAKVYSDASPLSSKNKVMVTKMVNVIVKTLLKQVNNSSWINKADKEKLTSKIKSVKFNIGFPSWIKDGKKVDEETGFGELSMNSNVVKLVASMKRKVLQDELKKINQEVKYQWTMSPATVDVSFDSLTNTINIPAAIMQLIYFDLDLPAQLTYPALGFEIAKQLLKRIDLSNIHFNNKTKLESDVSSQFVKELNEKTKCYIDAYNIKYENLTGNGQTYQVDGKRTLNENMIDNEALKLVYYAFQSIKNSTDFMPNVKLPTGRFNKYSDDQLFFIAYGNSRCVNDEISLPRHITSSSFAPEKDQMELSLINFGQFATTFNCSKSSPYNKVVKRCSIWTE